MTPTEYIERNWTVKNGCQFTARDSKDREYACVVFKSHKWDVWAFDGEEVELRGMAADVPINGLTVIR